MQINRHVPFSLGWGVAQRGCLRNSSERSTVFCQRFSCFFSRDVAQAKCQNLCLSEILGFGRFPVSYQSSPVNLNFFFDNFRSLTTWRERDVLMLLWRNTWKLFEVWRNLNILVEYWDVCFWTSYWRFLIVIWIK